MRYPSSFAYPPPPPRQSKLTHVRHGGWGSYPSCEKSEIYQATLKRGSTPSSSEYKSNLLPIWKTRLLLSNETRPVNRSGPYLVRHTIVRIKFLVYLLLKLDFPKDRDLTNTLSDREILSQTQDLSELKILQFSMVYIA